MFELSCNAALSKSFSTWKGCRKNTVRSPLWFGITINGTMLQFSCKLTVRSSHWDAKANQSGRQKPRSPAHQQKAENQGQASAIGIRMSRPKRSATPASVWAMTTACCCRSTTTNACGLRMPRRSEDSAWKSKNLEAAARHEIEITGPIDAVVRDTVVIRDTVPILRQKVEMITPHIQLAGLIENGRLKESVCL